MKKHFGIITILTIAISGWIGYSTNFTTEVKANDNPIIFAYTDIPKPTGFNLFIDLNKNEVVANTSDKINVDIKKKDSIVYQTKIKYVKVPESTKNITYDDVRKSYKRYFESRIGVSE